MKVYDVIVYFVGVGSGMDDFGVKGVVFKDDYVFYVFFFSEFMFVVLLIFEKICLLKGK